MKVNKPKQILLWFFSVRVISLLTIKTCLILGWEVQMIAEISLKSSINWFDNIVLWRVSKKVIYLLCTVFKFI